MLNKMKGYTLNELLVFIVTVVGVIGYVLNIFKIYTSLVAVDTIAEVGPLIIFRIIGIFAAPLGAILGYF